MKEIAVIGSGFGGLAAAIRMQARGHRVTIYEQVDDIRLFARCMPGVVAVVQVGPDLYLYRTEKRLPLAGVLQTEFTIRRYAFGDSVVVYASPDTTAGNFMWCRVTLTPCGTSCTAVAIQLVIRLSRENPSSIHWLAPVLGEQFISDRMTEDLDAMLEEFVAASRMALQGTMAEESGE